MLQAERCAWHQVCAAGECVLCKSRSAKVSCEVLLLQSWWEATQSLWSSKKVLCTVTQPFSSCLLPYLTNNIFFPSFWSTCCCWQPSTRSWSSGQFSSLSHMLSKTRKQHFAWSQTQASVLVLWLADDYIKWFLVADCCMHPCDRACAPFPLNKACLLSMELYISTPSWDAATQINSMFVPCQLWATIKHIQALYNTTFHDNLTTSSTTKSTVCATVSSRWLKSSHESARRLIMVSHDFVHQMVIKL